MRVIESALQRKSAQSIQHFGVFISKSKSIQTHIRKIPGITFTVHILQHPQVTSFSSPTTSPFVPRTSFTVQVESQENSGERERERERIRNELQSFISFENFPESEIVAQEDGDEFKTHVKHVKELKL